MLELRVDVGLYSLGFDLVDEHVDHLDYLFVVDLAFFCEGDGDGEHVEGLVEAGRGPGAQACRQRVLDELGEERAGTLVTDGV